MYRQRERRREGGTEGRSTPGPQCSAPNADIPSVAPSNSDGRMDGRWTDGRGRTLEMRDIGPSGPSGEAPWGEDNDGSVGAREGGFDLLAADGLD